MSKIFNCPNFIIIDNQRFNLVKFKRNDAKKGGGVSSHYFTIDKLDISLFERKEAVFLLPFSQLFIENFFLPVQTKSKLDEVIRLKFFRQLSFKESDLYFSYYVDDNLIEDKISVICYAVKKSVVNSIYNMFFDKGIKVKGVLPLPLLFYIYHCEKDKKEYSYIYQTKSTEGLSLQKQGNLYIDRFSSYISFTIFHTDGIYLRSGNLNNLNRELSRTIDYLKNYLKIFKLIIYNDGKRVEAIKLLDRTDGDNIHLKDFFPLMREKLDKMDIKTLDLLGQIPREKKKKRNRYRFIISLFIFLIFASNIFSFTTYLEMKGDRLNLNKGKLLELEPAIKQLQDLQNQIDTKSEQLKLYKNIIENRQSYLSWMYELSGKLPDNVKIDQLNFEGDNMVLLAGSAPSASKVMENLQESDIFSNLEFIGGIVVDDNEERFRIAGDLINE